MRNHPGDQELREVALGARAPAGLARHLGACTACRELVAFLQAAGAESFEARDCPRAEDLVGLAALPARERRASPLQSHLTACLDCSLELESLARLESWRARPPAVAPARGARSLAETLRALVSFEMPAQLAAATRGAGGACRTDAVEAGFEAYRDGQYGRAARLLEKASRAGEVTPGLGFYRGVCLLRLGRSREAAASLEAAAREEPRNQEAHWYLAQALLACGQAGLALEALCRAAELRGDYRERAKRLARQLQRAMDGT